MRGLKAAGVSVLLVVVGAALSPSSETSETSGSPGSSGSAVAGGAANGASSGPSAPGSASPSAASSSARTAAPSGPAAVAPSPAPPVQRSPSTPSPVRPPHEPALPVPGDAEQATVERHVDGDTLALRGRGTGTVFTSTSQITVRLLEVDTPETKQPGEPVQCFGPEASAELARLAPVGSTVWAAADVERTDRYGRDLLYLWDASGRSVNLALVTGGFAKAVLYPPNDRYIDVLRAAERDARVARRGMWAACGGGSPAAAPRVSTAAPAPRPAAGPSGGCDPAYPDVCIPPGPPDLDCGDIAERRFRVLAPDPHRFDGNDRDGLGCEG